MELGSERDQQRLKPWSSFPAHFLLTAESMVVGRVLEGSGQPHWVAVRTWASRWELWATEGRCCSRNTQVALASLSFRFCLLSIKWKAQVQTTDRFIVPMITFKLNLHPAEDKRAPEVPSRLDRPPTLTITRSFLQPPGQFLRCLLPVF